ncbi:MAG: hypothetical protein M1827_005138 [Pycnora praestabilis]|nr:MAG: hypothetical protein M1827_005138 [Pycnora praestabilis]
MPSIPLHASEPGRVEIFPNSANRLPQLLKTPSGLAILELQGSINMPTMDHSNNRDGEANLEIPLGRLVFPDYSASDHIENTTWMKRVYLYVGRHQRLTGEVKKLQNPMAVIQRRETQQDLRNDVPGDHDMAGEEEELEIVEIVKWKILFSQRPEPVGRFNLLLFSSITFAMRERASMKLPPDICGSRWGYEMRRQETEQ